MEHNGVKVAGAIFLLSSVFGRLLEPVHPVDSLDRTLEGDQAQSLCEHFVLNDGSVVVNEAVFNGDGGDLGHKDTAESVGDRGVESDEREGSLEPFIAVEFDLEILLDLNGQN